MRKQEMEELKQGRAVTKTVPDASASRGKKWGVFQHAKVKRGEQLIVSDV